MISKARLQTIRTCGILGGLIFCAFTWIALLTFNHFDPPSPAGWPPNAIVHNGCGRMGARLAFVLFHYLGDGAYPLVLFCTVAAVARLARRSLVDLPLRFIGVGLLVSVTSSSVALLTPDTTRSLPLEDGGVLGIVLVAALRQHFSAVGTALVLLAALIVGVLLAADDLVLRIPFAYGWFRRKLGVATQIGNVLRSPMTLLSRGPRVATAGVGAGSGRAGGMTIPAGKSDAEPAKVSRSIVAGTLTKAARPSESAATSAVGEPAPTTPAQPKPPVVRTLGTTARKVTANPWPKELGDYVLPSLSLLGDPEYSRAAAQEHVVREKARILERALQEFRIDARVVEIDSGPVITLYEVELAAGVKVGQIAALSNDIARALKAPVVRVVPTLPGKNTIGIEVPNVDKEVVRLKELITLGGVRPTRMALPVFIGKDASGNPLIGDVTAMPHMLIAGTTGSGKSVCINSLIMSILMTQRPDHVKLILIDPKMVELSVFKDVPHLMCPIVTEMQRAEMILDWAATKMDERYELLAEAGVKNIEAFNRLGRDEIYRRFNPSNEQEKSHIPTHLPYIVILIDELADLMMTSGKEVEHHLARLAQKSRAVGIHLIVATQRPQANVVTGLIKSNLPCRIAFRVASRMDSRIVLDQNGAEVLMGQGDMLFLPPGTAKLVRAQGTFVAEEEVAAVLEDLRAKAAPEFHQELVRLRPAGDEDSGERDPLFDESVDIILETRRGSVSLLQRRLEIGYSRASRLIDQMAAAGIVGEYKGSQAREVCITPDEWSEIRKQRDAEMGEARRTQPIPDDPMADRPALGSADDDAEVPDLLDESIGDLRD